MTNKIKVSIITVCLNAQECIEKTINSVINQDYDNIEYIIIDGNSSDDTLNIINNYKSNVDKLLSEPDTGIYNAMNKGIKLVTGDYVIFLNAGDYFAKENIISRAVKYFEKYNHKIFVGDRITVSTEGKTWINRYNTYNKLSLSKFSLCHQCIFYHSELFKKFGDYDEKYIINADHNFNLKLIMKNNLKVKYLPFIIANFQLGGICTSQKFFSLAVSERNEISNKYFSEFDFFIYDLSCKIGKTIQNRKIRLLLKNIFAAICGYRFLY